MGAHDGLRADGGRHTRLDPIERTEQILDAATRSFRGTDYSAVSLDAVATEAGVTRGLLHHYFGSKRDLFLAVIEREVRIPPATRIVPEGADGDLDEVLGVCVDWWLNLIEAAGGLWFGAAGSWGFSDSDVDAVLVAARDELVERMIRELPFPDVDEALLRSTLRCFAALARVAAHEWLESGELTRDQTAALLRTALLGLVRDSVAAMSAADPAPGSRPPVG